MARNRQGYSFLGQSILNPARFVPVIPYGVEFTASGRPSRETGSWFRLDLVLRIRPPQDSDFPVRLAKAVGKVLTFHCPQMRGADDPPGALAVSEDAAAGATAVAVSGGMDKMLTPNRIVQFGNHGGVYMVEADPAPTPDGFSVFPPLDEDVPMDTVVRHLDSHDTLVYSGVLASDLDLSAVIGASERMEAYSIRLHEER